jgi:hypothetical protein
LTLRLFQDPAAALALVSVRPGTTATTAPLGNSIAESTEDDPDLQRAKDLIQLHYSVKMPHATGEDKGLLEARSSVKKLNIS